jgi:hypothetical protein
MAASPPCRCELLGKYFDGNADQTTLKILADKD